MTNHVKFAQNVILSNNLIILKKDYQNYDALYVDKVYDQPEIEPKEGAPIVSEEFFPLKPLTTDIEVNGSGFGSKELDFTGPLISEIPKVLTTVNDLLHFCFAFL